MFTIGVKLVESRSAVFDNADDTLGCGQQTDHNEPLVFPAFSPSLWSPRTPESREANSQDVKTSANTAFSPLPVWELKWPPWPSQSAGNYCKNALKWPPPQGQTRGDAGNRCKYASLKKTGGEGQTPPPKSHKIALSPT